jgi:hypothetical protein
MLLGCPGQGLQTFSERFLVFLQASELPLLMSCSDEQVNKLTGYASFIKSKMLVVTCMLGSQLNIVVCTVEVVNIQVFI